jgi:hypothetical protein
VGERSMAAKGKLTPSIPRTNDPALEVYTRFPGPAFVEPSVKGVHGLALVVKARSRGPIRTDLCGIIVLAGAIAILGVGDDARPGDLPD